MTKIARANTSKPIVLSTEKKIVIAAEVTPHIEESETILDMIRTMKKTLTGAKKV